jgi:hypothetical protein
MMALCGPCKAMHNEKRRNSSIGSPVLSCNVIDSRTRTEHGKKAKHWKGSLTMTGQTILVELE